MLMILWSDRGTKKKMGTWLRRMSVIGNVHRLLVRASGSKYFVGVLTPLCFISPHILSLALSLSLCGSGLS